jgi:DNA-binding response OmpR family regulator
MFGLLSKYSYTVLVLEDNLTNLHLVTKMLPALVPDLRVLEARTLAAARRQLAKERIDFFILDIHLPDGSGLDFLAEIPQHAPEARVVVVTAVPLEHYRSRAGSLGALHFLGKPVPPQKLASFIRDHIEARKNPAPPPQTGFSASLTALTPLDIIQLNCLGRRNQSLEFSCGEKRGTLVFLNGEIVHAATGGMVGRDALAAILGWPGGKVTEAPVPDNLQPTLHEGWQGLLLSIIQDSDELTRPVA